MEKAAMHVKVVRFNEAGGATLSCVTINGVAECFFLEPGYHEEKIKGITRIPAGTYKLGVRAEGGFHNRYKRKFPRMHKGMLEVKDVPNFKYVLIHIGNTKDDTEACSLPGTSPNLGASNTVSSSTVAYKKLYPKLMAAATEGRCTIEYVDGDRV